MQKREKGRTQRREEEREEREARQRVERIYKAGKYENSNRKRPKEGRGKKGERRGGSAAWYRRKE